MDILLTGGSGFIGRNIVESLSGKYDIVAPSREELDLMDEDAVREFFRANAVDVVIHSATKPGHRNAKDPAGLVYANTRMFLNVVRNKGRFKKLIYIGSGAEYDMRHYMPKMREEYFDAHVPVDETGYSKYIIAKHVETMEDAVELRLFGVFGKYEDYAIRFISNAICKALFGLPVTIKRNRRFDYLYIDDLMPVIEHFIQSPGGHKAYNVTPDSAIELYALAEMVVRVSGKDLPIVVREPGMGPEYSGDNSRLKGEMPGLRLTPAEDAIGRLYAWYAGNMDKLDKEKLLVDR